MFITYFSIIFLDFLLYLIVFNIFLYASLKHTIEGLQVMAQQLRALVVLAWDLGLILSIHKIAQNHL